MSRPGVLELLTNRLIALRAIWWVLEERLALPERPAASIARVGARAFDALRLLAQHHTKRETAASRARAPSCLVSINHRFVLVLGRCNEQERYVDQLMSCNRALGRRCPASKAYIGNVGRVYDGAAEAAELIQSTACWSDERWREMGRAAVERAYRHFADIHVLRPMLADWLRCAGPLVSSVVEESMVEGLARGEHTDPDDVTTS